LQFLPADLHGCAALKPLIIHLRALIGHRPYRIDDHAKTDAAVDPLAVIRKLWVIIRETSFGKRGNDRFAIPWTDIKIYILGVSPATRKSRQRKAASKQKRNPSRPQNFNRGLVNIPFLLGNRIGPTEIRDAPGLE